MIPLTVQFKACVYGRSTAGTAGSNPAEGVGICRLCLMCVVKVEASRVEGSLVQGSFSECVCPCM